ncbi:hypothetical protein GCM10027589_38360 [Actinocorallia lasiicapitis]
MASSPPPKRTALGLLLFLAFLVASAAAVVDGALGETDKIFSFVASFSLLTSLASLGWVGSTARRGGASSTRRSRKSGHQELQHRSDAVAAHPQPGWQMRTIAVCMAPVARRRWLDDIAETLHDYDVADHADLLRDFRTNAFVVILRSWTIDYTRSGAS